MVTPFQFLLIMVVLGAASFTVVGIAGAILGKLPAAKLLETGSILFAAASLMQLKLSGWFDMVTTVYLDAEKYPDGPPGEISRQIIHNPDAPFASDLHHLFFFDPDMGFMFAVVSLAVALTKVWSE